MEKFDVIIVGGSFAGMAFTNYLPKEFSVLILEKKTQSGELVESTGLITQATHDLFEKFVPVDKYIPNRITTIGVIGPDFQKHFFSHTQEPWIYSTDTPNLICAMAENLKDNVSESYGSQFLSYEIDNDEYPVLVTYKKGEEKRQCRAKFIVGADGAISSVAHANKNLSKNKKFLVGMEKVFYGDITFGPNPETTVYHFWFGEFSLGYGGWLSPTLINGKKAFRLGMAKLMPNSHGLNKIDEFIEILKKKNFIKIDSVNPECLLTFAHPIPIGGVLKNLSDDHSILIGDAAGFCGAFAADGIKGSLISAEIAAGLVAKKLRGEKDALKTYLGEMKKTGMISYYRKQLLYRKLWNMMKSNRTFEALINIIAKEKDTFLYQFCDSKDKRKSLMSVVLKARHLPQLAKYAIMLIMDIIR